MAGISISDLQAAIKGRAGLARTNRFRIVISSPFGDGQILNILCESCSLPGRQINTVDYSPWRNENKIPIGYTDEDVTCVFHLTNDYYVKDVFDKWLKSIVNPDSYLIQYVESYASTVDIYQLNEADQDVYAVKLLQAWPVSINSVELNNSDENNTQKLTVVFTYKTWTSEKLVAQQLSATNKITQRKKQETSEKDKSKRPEAPVKPRKAETRKATTGTFQGDINTNTQQFLA